ncbi:ArsR family transcriptional regulator [Pseudoalteromonas neustonica]|uniref:ArsR family transcriptional regulator n=1 Tax=Pseudoalteromonas neustonica TaxID=1840331 RepID=A0ABY3FER2_9GAMM|nr:ArsR family transcriptional regulator [Pseudoalteromonas neustonica]TVU83780.1 ArsR family transcriptional regulator [Pseudoalteromonas neustonica]
MKELFEADQRLVILRALAEAAGYSANCSMLSCVLSSYGHQLSRDKVRAHMRFLEDVNLITIDVVGDKTLVAKITEQGADVAAGRKFVDGIKRPAPGGI